MRRRRAESVRSRQAGIKRRGKSRTYPLPEDRWRGQSVPPAPQRQEAVPKKKNARLRKKSGVRAVTFYSGLACSSVVVIVIVMPTVIAFLARIPAFKVRSIVRAAAARIDGNLRVHAQRARTDDRSEEHTSELQSQSNLVCRLLLEKKKKQRSSMILPRLQRSCQLFLSGWRVMLDP